MRVIDQRTIYGDDDLDTKLLREMAVKAESYLRSFDWCQKLAKGDFVAGYGGIFALFLFTADVAGLGEHISIWAFIGDVPSAYLEAKEFPDPASAVDRYLRGVSEWISAVRRNAPLSDLIPIAYPKDEQSLDILETKLDTLRHLVLQQFHYESENTQ